MWLVNYKPNQAASDCIILKINFYKMVDLKYIKFYNYNVKRYLDAGVRNILIKGRSGLLSPKEGNLFKKLKSKRLSC